MYTTKYTLSYGRNIFIKVNGLLNQIQRVQEVYESYNMTEVQMDFILFRPVSFVIKSFMIFKCQINGSMLNLVKQPSS